MVWPVLRLASHIIFPDLGISNFKWVEMKFFFHALKNLKAILDAMIGFMKGFDHGSALTIDYNATLPKSDHIFW